MFATKPPFPANIETFLVFPNYENIYFEFKRNLQTFDKLSNVICGMLNRKGGYIIFGIDDETLQICGIANTPKLIDDFAQYIDKITGHKTIMTVNNQPLHPDNIVMELVPHPAGLIVVINRTPLEDIEYKMIDGSIYIRLNATTWNLKKEEKLYRKNDIDHFINSKTSEYNRFKRKTQEKIMKLNCQYEALEDNLSDIQRCLFQKILCEKEAAEKQLAAIKYGLLCCLI